MIDFNFRYEFIEGEGPVYMGKFIDNKTNEILGVVFLNHDSFFHYLNRNKTPVFKTQDLTLLMQVATEEVISYYSNLLEGVRD